MKTKQHYENHLANFYSWMIGDFEQKQLDFQSFLKQNRIYPTKSKTAIDLGAGHGIQSVALTNLGFTVTAIDFNKKLLDELKSNSHGQSIETIQTDICNVKEFSKLNPELIVCCGDTIAHLDNKEAIEKLIVDCKSALIKNGKLILSFRDYTNELKNEQRFIPVKSDDERILTCMLEYETEKVKVTDLLYEKTETGWHQKVSSYNKVRITTNEIIEFIEKRGMKIVFNETINRMQTIIAEYK
ncbi:class I SAM-dependent methyltransferase [Flavivirga rizhaonensis]|uniref:Class I SAM-dependent methyltransferase n=1 Tax=Flavivirga rizhaonensis TaxID=2559571 RepID=A0A4S1DYK1_9FLAO|nr:class I SAM-dependent methyltransferase [Flavivirga rizhaonensis]TGV03055.1 class I SAM-dependent methyltransferase [Flavivirga rizhaonensis]